MSTQKPPFRNPTCIVENNRFINSSTLEGLKLALSHCTKYEDRMFLQFLIKVEMRNAKG